MTRVEIMLLLVAGVGAGAMNAVVGAGTLITFPTLLTLGFPPVVANVSNTVGLVPGSAAGAYGFRASLAGRWGLVRRLVAATAIGGLVGGALLLMLPPEAFDLLVPPLLLASGVLLAVQPRVAAIVAAQRARGVATDSGATPTVSGTEVGVEAPLIIGVGLTGIYGGYFGAAQGVILLALLGIFLEGELTQVNGIKNVLAGVANFVSALLFIAIADVDWSVALVVAVGATIGGGLGGRYGRRLPAVPMRIIVVFVALLAAAWQFVSS